MKKNHRNLASEMLNPTGGLEWIKGQGTSGNVELDGLPFFVLSHNDLIDPFTRDASPSDPIAC